MHVTVIGAGAVGSTCAALLDRAGHEVTLVARGDQLLAVQRDGLTLHGAFGEWTTRTLVAVEALPPTHHNTTDLVLVCVKAQDARAAFEAHREAVNGTPTIVYQNGLDGVSLADEIWPDSPSFGCLAIFAASYLAPGSVTVTTKAPSYLGRGAGPAPSGARELVRELGDTLSVSAIDNFVGAQWTKLVVNQINALPAITGLSAQEVIGIRGLRRLMTEGMRETVQVGRARGVRFGAIQGLTDRGLRVFAHAPLVLGQILPLLFQKRMGDVPNPGSTLQSLRRGQLTEIDFLNGAVAREGIRSGVSTPVNTLLTALVHEVERTGTFISPDDVIARVRQAKRTR